KQEVLSPKSDPNRSAPTPQLRRPTRVKRELPEDDDDEVLSAFQLARTASYTPFYPTQHSYRSPAVYHSPVYTPNSHCSGIPSMMSTHQDEQRAESNGSGGLQPIQVKTEQSTPEHMESCHYKVCLLVTLIFLYVV